MKHKTFLIVLAVIFLLIAGVAEAVKVSDPANKHNLSSNATHSGPQALDPALGGTTEICVFCHTPHGGDLQGPLWNRKDITAVETFPLYNSATLLIKNIPEAQYNSTNYPNGSSRLCLSCHDGSTASGYGIGDVINVPNALGGNSIAMTVDNLSGYNSAINLAESHPISFVYDDGAGQVLSQIQAVKTPPFNGYQLPANPTVVVLDSQGRMQCTTCHDPHDDASDAGSGTLPPFWRNTSNGFDDAAKIQWVCDDCHSNGGTSGSDGDSTANINHDPSFPP